jgi:hypothetical protein
LAKEVKVRQDLQKCIKFDIYERLATGVLRFGDLLEALNGRGNVASLWKPNRMTLWRYLDEAKTIGHVRRNERMEYSLTASGRAELDDLLIFMAKREQGKSLRTASTYYREQINSESEIPPDYDFFRSRVLKIGDPFELYHTLLQFPHPLVLPVTTTVYGSRELRSIFRRAGERAIFAEQNRLALPSKFLKHEFQPIIAQLVWRYVSENIFRLYKEQARHRKGSATPSIERILGFKFSFNMTFDGKGYLDNLARIFDREERTRVGKRLVGLYLLAVVWGDCRLLEGVPVLDGAGLIDEQDLLTLKMMGREVQAKNLEILTHMAWRYLIEGGLVST